MSYTNEDIVRSLKVIREVCKRPEGKCDMCELYNTDYGDCGLICQCPKDWCISSPNEPWRAIQ